LAQRLQAPDAEDAVGELEPMVPKDRDGEFQTELFECCQRSEKALVLAMLEMDLGGVSTRKVSAIQV
jgi:transposase-like protein